MTDTPTTSVERLLPCPFCGSDDVVLRQPAISKAGSWVACISCGLQAPHGTGFTTEQAIDYWNRRPHPVPSQGVNGDLEALAKLTDRCVDYASMFGFDKAEVAQFKQISALLRSPGAGGVGKGDYAALTAWAEEFERGVPVQTEGACKQIGRLIRTALAAIAKAEAPEAAGLDFDTDWHVVSEAVNDAYNDGEGRVSGPLLEQAFRHHSLVVAHKDTIAKAEATHTPSDAAEREEYGCACRWEGERLADICDAHKAALRNQSPAVGEEELRTLLADCYAAMNDQYRETGGGHENPREPADEWSYGVIPLFVAIQRATGKNHDELLAVSRLTTEQRGNG